MKKGNIPFDIGVEIITSDNPLNHQDVARACLWILMRSKGKNMMAHVHALMHCNPVIAQENGYPSLRSSAKACGVSAEYMRKLRNQYRDEFGFKI